MGNAYQRLELIRRWRSAAEAVVWGPTTIWTSRAGAAASVDLQPGERVVLEQVQGLHASVAFAGPDVISAMPVAPPGPADAPVRVFPQ
jgi:hypothetical protein